MARYRESVCKLCRNEGIKLFLKGAKCETPKCAIDKRPYGSGLHGQGRKKLSEYAIQLREKQKMRRMYGLLEKQFRSYYEEAARKKGVTGVVLFQLLESRLDTTLFRSGLLPSRAQARQVVRHGHIFVNGRKLDIPSYRVKEGDLITVKDKSKGFIKAILEGQNQAVPPEWLNVDIEALAVKVIGKPEAEQMDPRLQPNLIVEYYSR